MCFMFFQPYIHKNCRYIMKFSTYIYAHVLCTKSHEIEVVFVFTNIFHFLFSHFSYTYMYKYICSHLCSPYVCTQSVY